MASATVFITLPLGVASYIYSLNHDNPNTTIVSFCKIRSYLIQSSIMMYRWFLVAACFDRYALTSVNVRLRDFAKVRIAYRVIAVIMIIWLILPIHVLIFFNIKGDKCFPGGSIAVSLYHSIYTIITGSVRPVSIMIVCAVLTHHNLVLKRQARLQLNIHRQNNNEHVQRKRDQQVVAMLLIQALVFVVTQTPWMLCNIYTAATIRVTNKSVDCVAIEQFINFIAESALYLLCTLSFYLYTLVSRTFRNELMKLLRCLIRHRSTHDTKRINPLTNDIIPLRTSIEPIHMLSYCKSRSANRK